MFGEIIRAKIPVYDIRVNGTVENSARGVMKSLEDGMRRGNIPVAAGNHILIDIPGTRPHHAKGSRVAWPASLSPEGTPAEWSSRQSWEQLSQDAVFLGELQSYLETQTDQGNSVYGYFGYVAPSYQTDHPPHIYPYGAQSIERAHFHIVPPYHNEPPTGFLDPNNPQQYQEIVRVLNVAGELCTQYWDRELRSFSLNGFPFKKTVETNTGDHLLIEHTFFGFKTLQDALKHILDLQEELLPQWQNMLEALIRPLHPPLKQSATLNAAIYFPRDSDRIHGQVLNQAPIWVSLFPVANILEMVDNAHMHRLDC